MNQVNCNEKLEVTDSGKIKFCLESSLAQSWSSATEICTFDKNVIWTRGLDLVPKVAASTDVVFEMMSHVIENEVRSSNESYLMSRRECFIDLVKRITEKLCDSAETKIFFKSLFELLQSLLKLPMNFSPADIYSRLLNLDSELSNMTDLGEVSLNRVLVSWCEQELNRHESKSVWLLNQLTRSLNSSTVGQVLYSLNQSRNQSTETKTIRGDRTIKVFLGVALGHQHYLGSLKDIIERTLRESTAVETSDQIFATVIYVLLKKLSPKSNVPLNVVDKSDTFVIMTVIQLFILGSLTSPTDSSFTPDYLFIFDKLINFLICLHRPIAALSLLRVNSMRVPESKLQLDTQMCLESLFTTHPESQQSTQRDRAKAISDPLIYASTLLLSKSGRSQDVINETMSNKSLFN